MKNILITCFFLFIFNLIIIPQSLSSTSYHPLSNAFGITVELGGTIPKTDYKIDELDVISRLLLEYYFPSRSIHAFGIRLIGGGGFLSGEVFSNDIVYPPAPDNFRTGFLFLGGGFVYAIIFGNGVPYASATIAYTTFDPGDGSGNQLPNNQFSIYNKNTITYSGEAGVRFPFGDMWSLNVGVNINFSNTDYLDDIKAGNNNDAFIGFFTGVSLYLGKNLDKDNDGVDDDIDLCPDTPEGAEVDEFGCSVIETALEVVIYDSSKDNFISNGIFTDGTIFCFQADIFRDMNDAENLQKKIVSLGYNSDIFRIQIGSSDWYSVRVGYFASYNEAQVHKENFFRQTKLKLKLE
ncbi:MAG TPA: SPOR domain-containing protein [Ignavibacteriaceae bacterium]|nr:SPOR domain-containing protein [Ignavibacteriaceae bacterium]